MATPQNTNFLIPNKYLLSFARLPNIQFFCQTVNLPGLNISEIQRGTPFVDLYSPGEKLQYDPLSVTFFVDEDLASWREVHDWMRALTFPTDFQEYKNLSKLSKTGGFVQPQFSDASVVILNSNQIGIYRFSFHDCFPTTLAPFTLSSSLGPDMVVTADATFRFSYFDIVKI